MVSTGCPATQACEEGREVISYCTLNGSKMLAEATDMEAGTVLVDRSSGLELMVVRAPTAPVTSVAVDGVVLVAERIIPASPVRGMQITTDPGMRG